MAVQAAAGMVLPVAAAVASVAAVEPLRGFTPVSAAAGGGVGKGYCVSQVAGAYLPRGSGSFTCGSGGGGGRARGRRRWRSGRRREWCYRWLRRWRRWRRSSRCAASRLFLRQLGEASARGRYCVSQVAGAYPPLRYAYGGRVARRPGSPIPARSRPRGTLWQGRALSGSSVVEAPQHEDVYPIVRLGNSWVCSGCGPARGATRTHEAQPWIDVVKKFLLSIEMRWLTFLTRSAVRRSSHHVILPCLVHGLAGVVSALVPSFQRECFNPTETGNPLRLKVAPLPAPR